MDGIPRIGELTSSRVRAVGTTFLGARPLVVLPVALAHGALLAASDGPETQRAALTLALGSTLVFFVTEAVVVRRRVVTSRWLSTSLALTAAALVLGAALSGGVASPFLPLLLAPLVVAFAAFGRRATFVLLAATLLGVVALALMPRDWPWPPIAEPYAGWMRLCTFAGAAVLAWTGVAGLTDAYADAAAALGQVGATVAHEIKNPLAAMKALVQVERAARAETDRGHMRLGVVLGEIDRLDRIVRDYLAFARPIEVGSPVDVDLGGLATEVVELLAARAAERGVIMNAHSHTVVVRGDRGRLREALFNLVDNALSATAAGGRVDVDVDARGVSVKDTGAGTAGAGYGLGLGITRAVVERHGGRLVLEANAGGGTVARMELG